MQFEKIQLIEHARWLQTAPQAAVSVQTKVLIDIALQVLETQPVSLRPFGYMQSTFVAGNGHEASKNYYQLNITGL